MTDFSKCLYSKSIPTEIFYHNTTDRDPIVGNLHISIEQIFGDKANALIIKITKTGDYGFLYSQTLKDDDYQKLKQNQGLLIDFSQFPAKFVELLNMCQSETKFGLYFIESKSSKSAEFNIVEKNPFKVLVHFSINLLKADENSLIRHLIEKIEILEKSSSGKIQEGKANETALNSEIAQLRRKIQNLESDLKSVQESAATAESILVSAHKDEMAQLERLSKEKLDDKEHFWLERESAATLANKAQVDELKEKLEKFQNANKDLVTTNCQLEVNYKEQVTRSQLLEEQSNRYSRDLKHARKENCDFEEQRHESDKKLTSLRLKCEELESVLVSEKNKNIRLEKAFEEESEGKRFSEKQAKVLTLEISQLKDELSDSLEESKKAGMKISKLEADCTSLNSKVLSLESEIVEKRQKIEENQATIKSLDDEIGQIKEELAAKNQNNQQILQQVTQTKIRLDEVTEKERTSQNVIAWLHRQLNDLQTTQVIRYTKEPSVSEFNEIVPNKIDKIPPKNSINKHVSRNSLLTKSDSNPSISNSESEGNMAKKLTDRYPGLDQREIPTPYFPPELLRARTMSPSNISKENKKLSSSYFK